MTKKIISISIDIELIKKLRSLQIKMIRKENVSVSLSAVIEKILWEGVKQI